MTIWRPNPALLRRPAYISLADQFARAIREGDLANGARLPPHRQLAHELGLSVQTVSRAYDELIRQGLISGEIGRGTFVRRQRREPEPPYLPQRLGEIIDLSILKPVCEEMHLAKLREALGWLAETLPATSGLSFRPNVVFPRHRAVAVEWLKQCGLPTSALNITLTNGATSAMTVALMTAAPPGSTAATEAIGHHTLLPLASYLGFNLEGLPIDGEGIIPEGLEEACTHSNIRAVFVQPSAINPTASLMSEKRRLALVEVARKYDIVFIENDVLGPLIEHKPPPIAALAPERTFYATTFTKITVPGLRTGYLVAPERFAAAVANRHLVSNWMATPMVAEIASKWVEDGTAMELTLWQRAALQRRHAIATEIMQNVHYLSHPNALHLWLPLPEDRSEERFVAQARLEGVGIAPGSSFRISEEPWRPAVRVSLASTTEAELRAGLGIIAKLLHADAETFLLAI
jgi:DNA-binding transcriptional MocR family regulator